MSNELIQQLEQVKQFSIGQRVYVPDVKSIELNTYDIEKIDIVILCNNYAHISLLFADKLGNICEQMKLEDFNRRFFVDMQAAYKALDMEEMNENE